MLYKIYQSIKQRILPQKLQRIPEIEDDNYSLQNAEDYDRDGETGSLAVIYELIIDKLKKIAPEKGKALDLCSGSGQLICKIAKEFPKIEFLGTDISENMLIHAEKNIKKYNISNLKFKKIDVNKINHLNKKFNLITCNFAFHHFKEKELIQILNNCNKLLTQNGIIFIWDIERPKTKKLAKWLAKEYNNKLGDFYYRESLNSYLGAFSYKELENIINKSNISNYKHLEPIFGNFFQCIHTKTKSRKTRKTRLHYS